MAGFLAPSEASAHASVTLLKEGDITLTGNFSRSGSDKGPSWSDQDARKDKVIFGSYGQPSIDKGSFTSGVFRAPATLEMYMAGFPSHSGTRIYLRDEEIPARTLDFVTVSDPGNLFRLRVWDIPPEWRNIRVRLIAEDSSPGTGSNWLEITLPRPASATYLYGAFQAAWRAVLMTFAALGILIPGFAVALTIKRRASMEPHRLILVALVASGLLGFVTFWAYFINLGLGKATSIAIVAAGCGAIGFYGWQSHKRGERLLSKAASVPIIAALLVAIFYSSLGFLYLMDENAGVATQRRFFRYPLPPDNVLPELLADRLYHNEPLRPTLFSDWQTSDRPPLQAGLVLLERPLWAGVGSDLAYQLISVFLQCTWVLGVWILLRSAGLGYRRIVPATAFCVLSGFCFLYSDFVWPKLLAAAFCLTGLSLFVTPAGVNFKVTRWEWFLAGLCFGLSLLSHSGSAFTIVGIFILAVYHRKSLVWRDMLPGLGSLLLLMLPWMAFQKLYDPPGDQLLKLSFTGALNHDLSFLQALGKAYHGMTVAEFLRRRWEDFKILFYTDSKNLMPTRNIQELVSNLLNEQFFAFFFALGVVNLGFLFRMFLRRDTGLQSQFKLPDRLVKIVVVTFPIWMFVMYEAHATVIHQGSLANVLLMFVAGALYIHGYFPRGTYLLLLFQAVAIFPITVFSRPLLDPTPDSVADIVLDPGMLTVALAALAALVWLGCTKVKEAEID